MSGIYLKVVNGEVRAFGDVESIKAPKEHGGGGDETGAYDLEITPEEWQAAGYAARLVDGEIVLGKDEAVLAEEWAAEIRAERDRRLRKCDKMSPMRWLVLTDEKKAEWSAYRQALLDIPEQEGFPWGGDIEAVPWPELPA